MKMRLVLGVVVGSVLLSLLVIPTEARAGDGSGTWEIEGTWIDRSAGTDYYGVTVTITRTGGNEYQMVTDYAGLPVWPEEAKRSLMVGPLWKVGPKEWAWSGIAYLQDEDGWPVWTLVCSGTWKMVGPDEVVTDDWYLALYDSSRNARYILDGGPPDFPPTGPYGPLSGGMYRIPHLTLAPAEP